MSDGSAIAVAGTSLAARLAKERQIPVLVLAESVKFTTRVLGSATEHWAERSAENKVQFDITPPLYIDAILTDIGDVSIPATSVPYVAREVANDLEIQTI